MSKLLCNVLKISGGECPKSPLVARLPGGTFAHLNGMGVRRNFSRGGQRRHFPYPFSGCERCNANGPSQNAFYPFYITKKNPHESTRSVRNFLKSYWGGVVLAFAKKLHFLSSFTAFAELGYHPISSLLWTADNWAELDLNYPQLHVCGAHISLCGLNLTSQNLVWNIFYFMAIRNAFSFHKLFNTHSSSNF